jgi:DNA repair protein RadB
MRELKISAGSYDLNKFLFGGYETDIITTIYGPAGSGKTNFCILAALSQAKKGNKIIYIDTEGGFSIDRARQILKNESYEEILKNIMLLKPTSFDEQEVSFGQLLKNVKRGDISLIIIDSMTILYRLELGDAIQSGQDIKIKEINRKLARQLRILNEIARKQQIPIIITNQVYSDFITNEQLKEGIKKSVNMVGGDLLKYWSKCLIELKYERGKRTLILRKHRSLPEKELEFEIVSDGIRKRGWI